MSSWQQPRAPSEGEWPALRAAMNQVFRPAGGDLTRDSPLLFEAANRENLRVIVRGPPGSNGEIVSHAGFVVREALVFRRRIRVACVGAVFTVPEHRGQGLASRVLADVLGAARHGTDLVLCSGERTLYRRQGLDPIPPLARFCVTAAGTHTASRAKDVDVEVDVREAKPDDLDACAALYEAEDVHFIRPPDDWRRLWEAGLLVDAPATLWIAHQKGRVVAYLAAQKASPRPDGSTRPRRILEIAGDRAAIVAAAARVADELLVPAYDTAAIALCGAQGWTRTARQFLIAAEALTADVPVIPWYGLNYL